MSTALPDPDPDPDGDANVGTRPLAAPDAVDLPSLQAWLAERLDGLGGPIRIEQFKGGQSNPTFKLVTPQRVAVMRCKPAPAAKLLASAHAIEREFRVMRALHGTDVPVPEMLLLCEDESVIGRAFYLMDFIDGEVFWDPALPQIERVHRAAYCDEMVRVIAALHSVDVVAAGLADFGRAGNYVERQIGRWTRQYLASVTEPIDAMDRLIDWLPKRVPASARDDREVAVVHGDFRLDNLVFARGRASVVAVLDWELSTIGHPLADFSYHCLAWHIRPGHFRGIGGLDLEALGLPDERHHVRRYCELTGRVGPGRGVDAVMAEWPFYLAYNLFRLAAILQGIGKRIEDGTASSAQARDAAAGARPLAEMGWALAQRA